MDSDIKNKTTIVEMKDGYPVNYKYQVVFVDEYNNWYLIGFFNNLEDAEEDLNSYLKTYTFINEDGEEEECAPQFGDEATLGHLKEYASTFCSCFDRIIDTSCGCVEVRGFVF